jgi:hypothetical protein
MSGVVVPFPKEFQKPVRPRRRTASGGALARARPSFQAIPAAKGASRQPFRFAPSCRAALTAFGYAMPGVDIVYDTGDFGDEWVAIVPKGGDRPARWAIWPQSDGGMLVVDYRGEMIEAVSGAAEACRAMRKLASCGF